jgi:hypothetical protein
LTAHRTGLLRDVRGAAIYVELLLVVPLIALLWMCALYVHRLGESNVRVQRQARQCAWAHAAGGCRGEVPAGCELEGPARLDGPELDRVAGSGLASVVSPIQSLAAQLRAPAGNEVIARGTAEVSRPPLIGGPARATGAVRMMCNDRPRAPQLPEVMDLTCTGLLGPEGRCR